MNGNHTRRAIHVIASAAKQSRLCIPHPEERGTRVSRIDGPLVASPVETRAKGALLRVRTALWILHFLAMRSETKQPGLDLQLFPRHAPDMLRDSACWLHPRRWRAAGAAARRRSSGRRGARRRDSRAKAACRSSPAAGRACRHRPPRSASCRRHDFVDQDDAAVLVAAELELGVGDDDALLAGELLAERIDRARHALERVGDLVADDFSHLGDGDVLVMASLGLGRRAEDRRLQLLALDQSRLQLSPASVPLAAYSFQAEPER